MTAEHWLEVAEVVPEPCGLVPAVLVREGESWVAVDGDDE